MSLICDISSVPLLLDARKNRLESGDYHNRSHELSTCAEWGTQSIEMVGSIATKLSR